MSEGNGDVDVKDIPELEIKVLKPGQTEEKKKKGGFFANLFAGAAGNPAGMLASFLGGGGLKIVMLGMGLMGMLTTYAHMHASHVKEAKVKFRSRNSLSGMPSTGRSNSGPAGPTSSLGFLKYANPNFKFDEAKKPEAKKPEQAAASADANGGQPGADPNAAANPMAGMMDQMKGAAGGVGADGAGAGADGSKFKGKDIGKLSSSLQTASFGSGGGGFGGGGGGVGKGFADPGLRKMQAPQATGSLAMPRGAALRSVGQSTAASQKKGRGLAALRNIARSQRYAMNTGQQEPAYQQGVQDFDGGKKAEAITGGGMSGAGGTPTMATPSDGGAGAGGANGDGGASPTPFGSGGPLDPGGAQTDAPWSKAQTMAQLAMMAAIPLLCAVNALATQARKAMHASYKGHGIVAGLLWVAWGIALGAFLAALAYIAKAAAIMFICGQNLAGGVYAGFDVLFAAAGITTIFSEKFADWLMDNFTTLLGVSSLAMMIVGIVGGTADSNWSKMSAADQKSNSSKVGGENNYAPW